MANSTAERQIVSLKIVHTSDVHGSFFMRDYVNNHAVNGEAFPECMLTCSRCGRLMGTGCC